MKNLLFIILVLVLMLVMAVPAFASPPSCNWGQVTSYFIAIGFEQGPHASDPSADGLGPEQRVGLANVIEQGNLNALCEFIEANPPLP